MIALDTHAFEDFAARLTIPSRDEGMIHLRHLYGTQRYLLAELARGLAEGIHNFIILKGGRQIGGSTLLDGLTLWWLQTNAGMVGQMISDDLGNMKYRRKLLRQMLASLPKDYRWPINADNLDFLEWSAPNGSTLLFDYAGIRPDSNLGRSKGVNFLYADEVGSWKDQRAVAAIEASLSEHHASRFSAWIATARGFNVFYEMWEAARTAITTRPIFVAWWRHDGYRITAAEPELWARYGAARRTADERRWIGAVKAAYDVEIEPTQLAWYRWKLEEKFLGDEAMMSQEFSNIPTDAFQSFGDKFIPPSEIQRLRLEVTHAPAPTGSRYIWGQHIDEVRIEPAAPDKAPLLVWEEPEKWGAYIIAGHPWGSSSPNATEWVAQVYRAWPDKLVQCAEYSADTGTTYEFAWLLIHLAGAYNLSAPPFLIVEANGPGYAVMKQIQLLRDHGYGLSSGARTAGLHDFLGAFRHYFYVRPDNITWRSAPIDWKTSPDIRPYLLHSLADTVIRGDMTVRSVPLINSMAGLRRGEAGDNDTIEGGSGRSDAHAICAALAVKCWQDFAMGDLVAHIAPKEVERGAPTRVEHALVANFMSRLLATGRTR